MAIEFACVQCQTRLRVADDAAGKQAKCPKCGTVLTVPQPAISVPTSNPAHTAHNPAPTSWPAAPSAQPRSAAEINPYASPAMAAQPPESFGPLHPGTLDLGRVLSHTWNIYMTRGQLGWCILATVIVGVLQQGVGFAMQFVTPAVAQAIGFAPLVFGIAVVSFVGQLAFQQWLNLGLIMFMLKVARGDTADLADVFRGGPFLLRALGLILLIYLVFIVLALLLTGIPAALTGVLLREPGIGLVAGIVLMIFPMIYIGLAVSQVMYLYVDRNAGFMEGIQQSYRLTKGKMPMLFLVFLVVGLIMMAGALACLVGLFFTVPFGVLAMAVVYMHLTSDRGEAALENQ